MNYKIPRGTYDILPSQSHDWHKIISAFRQLAAACGYEEITTPVFEQAQLFERSSGETSDVVKKEMYRFTDQKGREFALRPEGTAPVARSYLENRLDIGAAHSKLYYVGPMFRYDRPQAGRYRQFYQYGIEFIGSDHPYFDAEVISILWNYLSALGIKRMRLELNSVGCPECSKAYDQALQDYFAPHLSELCPDCQIRHSQKPRRLLDCKVKTCKQIAQGAPSQLDYLDEPCKEHFASVQDFLARMNIPFVINPRIVRGLDYYTNTAFEVVYEGLGAQNSLAGGGRYNGLLEQIGGKNIPAIGFAGGFDACCWPCAKSRLTWVPDLLRTPISSPWGPRLSNWHCLCSASSAWAASGWNTIPPRNSFKAQLKAANNCQARFALIIGEDEAVAGKALLKDLQSGEQHLLELNSTNQFIEALKHR